MVRLATIDLEGAVELLDQHDAGVGVGEGHWPKRKQEVRTGTDGITEPIGPADQKEQVALTIGADLLYFSGQSLRGNGFAHAVAGNDPAALGNPRKKPLALFFAVGAGVFLNFEELERAGLPTEALDVLRDRVFPERLAQLADAEHAHLGTGCHLVALARQWRQVGNGDHAPVGLSKQKIAATGLLAHYQGELISAPEGLVTIAQHRC